MNPYQIFKQECAQEIEAQNSPEVREKMHKFIFDPKMAKYVYHFEWLGRPIIQTPQDMVQLQELVWQVKPDLIIETGIAHGGSLVLSASLLALLEMTEACQKGELLNPAAPRRLVAGIDIELREHNRKFLAEHPLANRIHTFDGSSIDEKIVSKVKEFASDFNTVMVLLDSNHSHEHVLAELKAYSPLVSTGSYLIVYDTIVEDIGLEFPDKPWGPGNNPKTAVYEFIKDNKDFVIDEQINNKLMWTSAPDGYLRRLLY